MDKCKYCGSTHLATHQRPARTKNRIPAIVDYCADCGRDQPKGDTFSPPPCITTENPGE